MNTNCGTKLLLSRGWHFLLADRFPLADAIEQWLDKDGRPFFDPDYQESGWTEVTIPHTFNDVDLFKNRIEDAGSGQKRTCAFYRRFFTVPKDRLGQKAFLAFEGIRQTCYCYVNGILAGTYEAGVAPFGFDITAHLKDGENLIAIATDNTCTRNIPFCIAETPNHPKAAYGSFFCAQDEAVPPEHEGVGFFWNCNDFNPSVGGLTRPVYLIYKPFVHLTLPLYSNLRTKGTYLYAVSDGDGVARRIGADLEIRNETNTAVCVTARLEIRDSTDKTLLVSAKSEPVTIPGCGPKTSELSVVPEDAYKLHEDEYGFRFIPSESEEFPFESLQTKDVCALHILSEPAPIPTWDPTEPNLCHVTVLLEMDGTCIDREEIVTGFPEIRYDKDQGVLLSGKPFWLRGYAQRATNEWAAIGIAPEWLKQKDALLIRESNANHIRYMHVGASPADIRACDRAGIVVTQPAGDKEKEQFGRSWMMRMELMRDIIIAFRNHPSILFWEAGNNSISAAHMQQMRRLKELLDPKRGRFMGCRTLNTEETVNESEYVGTMLNRHAARFLAEHGPVTETEYSREEAPRRVWDDYSPPDYDYKNRFIGVGGKKQPGGDFYDLTSEDLALANARGYSEFFNDRIGGASHKDLYSACAALCWTDSAQHGRQAFSENARMSGRVDPCRTKKQSFDIFRVIQSALPQVTIVGHYNYPDDTETTYLYDEKVFDGQYFTETGKKLRRDPHHKTVYVIASYPVAAVALIQNGKRLAVVERPENTFVYVFPDVDVTRHGTLRAEGFTQDGILIAADERITAGNPARLSVTPVLPPEGLAADGAGIACFDLAVLDTNGQVCPLADERIEFTLDGPAIFLGGYNSGRFDGHGRHDSVIHAEHVYAECGTNRVFIRTTTTPGTIRLTARAAGLSPVCVEIQSMPVEERDLPVRFQPFETLHFDSRQEYIPGDPVLDVLKYVPGDEHLTKILVNGQEPDTRGVPSRNENGRVWGNVCCILERIQGTLPGLFSFVWDAEEECLTVKTATHLLMAKTHATHLLINGTENLMDGEPYLDPKTGAFVMEVSALVPQIDGLSAYYDDKIGVYRITTL